MTSEERDGATEVAGPGEPDDERSPDEAADEAADEAGSEAGSDDAGTAPERRRDHPTFVSLAGFYTGLVYVLVVPAGVSGLLATALGYRRATPLFPFVLLALIVPIALLVPERTRRFARYMLLGVLLTTVVVLGVAGIVLWLLITLGG